MRTLHPIPAMFKDFFTPLLLKILLIGNNFLDCGYGSKEEINPVQTVAYAILHRGPETDPVPFLDKIRNVTDTNRFLGCIIVDENNNLNSTFSVLEGSDTTNLPKERLLPTVIISKNLYEVVKNYMNEDSLIILRQSEKSVVSDFTCTGPCGDGDFGSFKPDVCAPGKQISSAALSKEKAKMNTSTDMKFGKELLWPQPALQV